MRVTAPASARRFGARPFAFTANGCWWREGVKLGSVHVVAGLHRASMLPTRDANVGRREPARGALRRSGRRPQGWLRRRECGREPSQSVVGGVRSGPRVVAEATASSERMRRQLLHVADRACTPSASAPQQPHCSAEDTQGGHRRRLATTPLAVDGSSGAGRGTRGRGGGAPGGSFGSAQGCTTRCGWAHGRRCTGWAGCVRAGCPYRAAPNS